MSAPHTLGNRPILNLKQPSTRPPDESSTADKRRLVKEILNRSLAWRDCLPLAIGFHRIALQHAPEGLRKQMRAVIHFRCISLEYQAALAAGGPRYNFNGQPVGEVTKQEMARAARELKQQEQMLEEK